MYTYVYYICVCVVGWLRVWLCRCVLVWMVCTGTPCLCTVVSAQKTWHFGNCDSGRTSNRVVLSRLGGTNVHDKHTCVCVALFAVEAGTVCKLKPLANSRSGAATVITRVLDESCIWVLWCLSVKLVLVFAYASSCRFVLAAGFQVVAGTTSRFFFVGWEIWLCSGPRSSSPLCSIVNMLFWDPPPRSLPLTT